jgi:hypothetical protein
MSQIEIKRKLCWFGKPKLQPESKKEVGRVVRMGSDEIGIKDFKGEIRKTFKGESINSNMGEISADASNVARRVILGEHILVSLKKEV